MPLPKGRSNQTIEWLVAAVRVSVRVMMYSIKYCEGCKIADSDEEDGDDAGQQYGIHSGTSIVNFSEDGRKDPRLTSCYNQSTA